MLQPRHEDTNRGCIMLLPTGRKDIEFKTSAGIEYRKMPVFADISPVPVPPRSYQDIDVFPGMSIAQYLPEMQWYQDKKQASKIWRRWGELNGKTPEEIKHVKCRYTCEFGDLSVNYDTETTTIYKYAERDERGRYKKNEVNPDGSPKVLEAYGYRYYFQIGIGGVVFHCRTWEVANDVFKQIAAHYRLTDLNKLDGWYDSVRLLRVLHANSSFEFAFLQHDIELYDLFADQERQPMTFTDARGFLWQDALRLCNGSLNSLAKNYATPTSKTHDLDYNIPRNSQTVLTDKEKEYCSCDVRILAELNEYIINNYVEKGFPYPLTQTGFIRFDVKKTYANDITITKTDKKGRTRSYISTEGKQYRESFPMSYDEYSELIDYLFQGGFTHAAFKWAGRTLYNVNGWDFTSSYPYSIIFQTYPVGNWTQDDAPDLYNILDRSGKYATRCKITLTHLRPKTPHSIISLSKTYNYNECETVEECVQKYNMIVDNGRILAADSVTIMATDLDLQSIVEAYDFDSYPVIENCYYSKYGYLPDAIRYIAAKYYQKKAALKRAGLDGTPEYKFAKAMVNALYGMMCEHLHFNTILFDGAEWETTTTEEQDLETKYHNDMFGERDNKYSPLNPYWGVWTTAHARRNLLAVVLDPELSADVVYCDTDSAYLVNPDEHKEFFEVYNLKKWLDNTENVNAWNKRHGFDLTTYRSLSGDDAALYMYDHRGIDPDLVTDLGQFDPISKHGNYTRFKTLGAKRYVKEWQTEDGFDFEQTIAGLPKTALKKHIDSIEAKTGTRPDVFEFVQDKMYIPACKLGHQYHDETHSHVVTDEQGHTEVMTERGSVGLFPIGFSMGLSDDYLALLLDSDITRNQRRDPRTNVGEIDKYRLKVVTQLLDFVDKATK